MERAPTQTPPGTTRAVYVNNDHDFTLRMNDILRARSEAGWRFVAAVGDPSVFGGLAGMWLFFSKD